MTIIVDNLIFFAFIIFHCEHFVKLGCFDDGDGDGDGDNDGDLSL